MATLSVKIMAHKKRAKYLPHLVASLGITDDDVIWDTDNNRWHTGRRAWEAVDQEAEWGCVIQDDAVVSADFISGMSAALDHVSNCAVSPYVGTRRPMAHRVEAAVRAAEDVHASWIKMPALNWGVAIIVPTRVIDEMLPWCDKQTYPNYDRRVGRFVIDVKRMPTMCTWPSLVDHREIPSLVGHGDGRTAHRFIGEDSSALDLIWTGPTVTLTHPRMTAYRVAMDGTQQPVELPRYDITTVSGRVAARQLRVPRRTGYGKYDTPPVRPGA